MTVVKHHEKAKSKTVAENKTPVKLIPDENASSSDEHTYVVRPGDNLHQLAERFNTTSYHIMQHNHLKNAELSVGEHLLLPHA